MLGFGIQPLGGAKFSLGETGIETAAPAVFNYPLKLKYTFYRHSRRYV